ncbi:MAG: four helix bundle protein [Prolixibacteraceae bacterium]|jgi:four helix bundle protein|nr:four helix bundle protein [Prolixibacteraceae bacterium]
MNNFKELKVWQQSVDLVVDIYQLTRQFPSEEMYGITSQIRRSSISIPSNIAEGAGRIKPGDFNHFLNIARGSSNELETQLIIAERLNFIDKNETREIFIKIDEIQRMITGLQKTLKV